MTRASTIRPLGDTGLLVEFGATIDPLLHEQVIALDAALAASPPPGLVETVPAYASLLIVYDPLLADPDAIEQHVLGLAAAPSVPLEGAEHVVSVGYGGEGGPDLQSVAARLGTQPETVIERHLSGDYRVYMYGFAPGYAYLGGVPEALRLPRKEQPERGHPAGSVMIAGGQCLITTLPMPTGWWVIGRTDCRVLDPNGPEPFRFAPGDRVRFVRAAR